MRTPSMRAKQAFSRTALPRTMLSRIAHAISNDNLTSTTRRASRPRLLYIVPLGHRPVLCTCMGVSGETNLFYDEYYYDNY